jgi:hypothetical protein
MTGIASLDSLQSSASQPRHLGLADVADFAISAYASFDDFTLLHAVTATHAFRLISPFIADSMLGHIAARAIESDDEHVIKLVYAAFAEFRIYADPLYQYVAMRQVASISTIALAG